MRPGGTGNGTGPDINQAYGDIQAALAATGIASGDILYVGSTGGLTTTQPATGSSAVAVVAKSGSAGILIVGQLRGNGTWGSLKAGLS